MPTFAVHPRIRKAVANLALSRRQAELVERFASGHTTQQVSKDLDISETTVRTHLRRIFFSLKIASRTELVALVLSEVLTDADRHTFN